MYHGGECNNVYNSYRAAVAIIWTNAYPIHWRIYAAVGGDANVLSHVRMASNRRQAII